MRLNRRLPLIPRVVGTIVICYGILIIATVLLRHIRLHGDDPLAILLIINVPLLIGLGYVYLGRLLLRRKFHAWLTACGLLLITVALNSLQLLRVIETDADYRMVEAWLRVIVPSLLFGILLDSREQFSVRSDTRSFKQALQISALLLAVAFLYGVAGFMLLDNHDVHQHITLFTAMHQTVDQFGLTDDLIVAHSLRARLFLDSLPVISIGALIYAAISFFQPIRSRLTHHQADRQYAEQLLRDYPCDIDSYFALWPRDKSYYFDTTGTAGLAYHVNRGVALVVGDPFGDSKRFPALLDTFLDFCFVNDWLPSLVHTSGRHRKLYERHGLGMQKIGEEAVLQLETFKALQHGKPGKYFREIRNRFAKKGYYVEVVQPPHSQAILDRLREITEQWLTKPGREERSFLLGYHSDEYLQQGPIALLRDEAHQIQAFINVIPTFEPSTANYDMLRSTTKAPGNSNDFLLVGLLDYFVAEGYETFNLGLAPLAGMDQAEADTDTTIIDNALRLLYSNGDRFYSFSGLHRFKDKYHPSWEPRYIAYPGGIRNFTRILAALNRSMKLKHPKSK